MGVRLPPEYQEVEYLESDKNQRIVLNIKPSITDVITIKYKLTNIEYNTGIYGSARDPVYFGIGTNANFANYYAQIGSRAYRQSSVPKDTNIHTHVLDMPRLIYSVDGIETSLAGLTPNPNTNTGYGLWFHHGAYGSYLRYTAGRIYFFDIKDRITLVPCYRKSDDKPGMYDLVSGTFFVNQGTGEFLVGPDVIDSISPMMVAWRRMLMRKPPLDTSPRIAEYGKHCGRSNEGLVENADWCYSDWYDFPKPHGNITYQQLTGMDASHTFQEINTDTGGRTWNYPNISITSNYDKVRFSIKISLLSTCYFVRDDTGEIIFAGRDSIYYGHKNISEIT